MYTETGSGLPCFRQAYSGISAMGFARLIDLGALDEGDDPDPLDAGGEQPGDRTGDQGGQEYPLKH